MLTGATATVNNLLNSGNQTIKYQLVTRYCHQNDTGLSLSLSSLAASFTSSKE